MTQWYVKELSQLTDISVQTLHHYDRIGLLKPSVRLPNGYRLYSENDLLKLQQIIALKFFDFELAKIKELLATEVDIMSHFSAQARSLEENAKALLQASKTLQGIISQCSDKKSIPWESLIKSIEVYRMTEKLENKWAAKVFDPDMLKQYVEFEQSLKTRFTDSEKLAVQQQWADLVEEVRANLNKNPNSQFGIEIGKRGMEWVNHYYEKRYVKLRNAIWNLKIRTGKQHEENEYVIPVEVADWLDQAFTAYYKDRIHRILDQVGSQPDREVLLQMESLLLDACGDDKEAREEFLDVIMNDSKVSQAAKKVLQQMKK